VIVDVGGGFGDFAILAARRFPSARVLTFEPDPESFARLTRNVAANATANVTAHQLAIGTASSYALSAESYGAGGFTIPGHAGPGELAVEGRTLENVLPPGPIDLLKIDCEGAEDDVLASLSPDGLQRVNRVALEYHGGDAQASATAALLVSAGFEVTHRPDPFDPRSGYLHAVREG
jgi:FkbM family methyltransferase